MTGEAPVGVLEDGTVYYAPLGEILHDGDDLILPPGRAWLWMLGGSVARWLGGRRPGGPTSA